MDAVVRIGRLSFGGVFHPLMITNRRYGMKLECDQPWRCPRPSSGASWP
jgi:hypothetical protein